MRHYFDVINYGARTGNTAPLRELSEPDCVSCDAIASNIERIYEAGGRVESDGWRLTIVSTVPGTSPKRPIFDLGVRQTPESVIPSSGAEPKAYPGGKKPMTIYLASDQRTWRVLRLDEVR